MCYFCPFSISITFAWGRRSWSLCLSCICLLASLTHVNLCHCFSSFWYQGLVATFACGSSWTFLFTFFQYLGIDRIIGGGGGQAISNYCCPAPCLEAAPSPMRVWERVCVCVFLLSNLPATPTHTPVQCAARHTVVQARKNVIDNVHVQYYIAADTEKT